MIAVKTYSKKELKELYNISYTTLANWISKFEDKIPEFDKNAQLFTPAQVRVIFDHLGTPDTDETA